MTSLAISLKMVRQAEKRRKTVRTYELVCVFRSEQELYAQGKQKTVEVLSKHEAQIQKEEDMGERQLAYQIKKQTRGHYYVWVFNAKPEIISKLEHDLKYIPEVLRFLVTRVDTK
ncbi:30S ribosomal protein S6 [Spirochaeta thermophila]|uniref:Small ribosomal subunit protein bS6 n=1 Tax=Winmispira thermophila (strain ATCC 49972 / DSM 6192 / RI 19.B1) TaxID=665571 RepID=E0RTM9_WINT6|nr:30S ribosomal protein S6 [Spirochaeta thermophila]ADN02260.1 hypothetical protein STHERM_c13190 [Spirochaeta thermophila DSM 6192]